MTRRPLVRLILVLVAIVAVATTTAAPATAAPGGWQPAGQQFTADATWVRLGHVRGTPGNASSGYLYVNTDESGTTPLLEQYDWSCPAGVIPPTSLDTTDCTLLRDRFLSPTSGGQVVFTGPVGARIEGTFATDPGATPSVESVAVTFRATGPVSRTTTVDGDFKTVTVTAPMALSGNVGDIRFADPKVSSSVSGYGHTYYFTR